MLSVCIVNWNTKDLLIACLESLFAHPPDEEVEVIVVDNASADGSAEALRQWASGAGRQALGPDTWSLMPGASLRFVQAPANLGYAAGNNRALEHAQGEWLLTLNPDTEVFEGTLQRAVDTLKRRPREGALGAKLVSPDGSVQRSVRGFPSLLGILGSLLGIRRLDSYTLPDFDYEMEQLAPQPMGTFLLFRREAIENLERKTKNEKRKGPFDESFPIFFNEVDLLKRLKDIGWGCVYDPSVRVLHHGGESTKQVRPKMIWESHRSLIRYLKKHTLRWWNAPLLALVAIVVWFGALVRARKYDVGFRP